MVERRPAILVLGIKGRTSLYQEPDHLFVAELARHEQGCVAVGELCISSCASLKKQAGYFGASYPYRLCQWIRTGDVSCVCLGSVLYKQPHSLRVTEANHVAESGIPCVVPRLDQGFILAKQSLYLYNIAASCGTEDLPGGTFRKIRAGPAKSTELPEPQYNPDRSAHGDCDHEDHRRTCQCDFLASLHYEILPRFAEGSS